MLAALAWLSQFIPIAIEQGGQRGSLTNTTQAEDQEVENKTDERFKALNDSFEELIKLSANVRVYDNRITDLKNQIKEFKDNYSCQISWEIIQDPS